MGQRGDASFAEAEEIALFFASDPEECVTEHSFLSMAFARNL